MKTLIPTVLLAAMLFAACKGDVATPRRKAFPRIPVVESSYAPVGSLPVNLEANKSAIVTPDSTRNHADGSVWLNITYPCYRNATIFVTLTPVSNVSDLESIIDNRLERMALNSGGGRSELTEMTSSGGFAGKVMVTPIGTVTPVQFLANDDRMVVTGAFYLPDSQNSAPDSVGPVIDAVRDDIIHLVSRLSRP